MPLTPEEQDELVKGLSDAEDRKLQQLADKRKKKKGLVLPSEDAVDLSTTIAPWIK
jgi:hypothetical protein